MMVCFTISGTLGSIKYSTQTHIHTHKVFHLFMQIESYFIQFTFILFVSLGDILWKFLQIQEAHFKSIHFIG